MATNQTMRTIVLEAGGDLSSDQFKLVKITAGGTARQVNLVAAVTDTPIGVLQNKPDAAGKAAIVALLDGAILKMVAGEAVAVGALVGLHTTDGTVGVPGDAGEVDVGIAVEAAAAAADVFEVATGVIRAHA